MLPFPQIQGMRKIILEPCRQWGYPEGRDLTTLERLWGLNKNVAGVGKRRVQVSNTIIYLFFSACLYQLLGKSYREMWAFTLWLLYEPASHHHQSDVSVFIFLYPPKPPSKLPAVSHLWETTSNVTLIFSRPLPRQIITVSQEPSRVSFLSRPAGWLVGCLASETGPACPLLPCCAPFPIRPLPGRSLSLYLPHVKIHQHKRLLMRMGRDRAKRKTPQSDKNRSIAEPNGARGTKAIHKLSTAQWTHTSDNPRQTQKGERWTETQGSLCRESTKRMLPSQNSSSRFPKPMR